MIFPTGKGKKSLEEWENTTIIKSLAQNWHNHVCSYFIRQGKSHDEAHINEVGSNIHLG